MITPLASGKLDENALEKLIEHTLSGGVHGLFLLGSTGEGPGLSQSLKIDLVRRTRAQVSGRVPILVAITDTVLEDSLGLAEASAKAGVDAVVVAPPYYLPPGQAEFLSFLDFMLPRLPLPLFLYNMPSMTKVHLSSATIAEAITRAGIAGLKDSSGDMNLFHALLRVRGEKDLSLFTGSETLLGESVLFGADGGVCGGANVNPGLFVDMFQAACDKKVDPVVALQAELQRFAAIYAHGHHASSGIKGIKCALSLLGVCGDEMAAPFEAFAPPEREQVRRDLEALGLLGAAPRRASVILETRGNEP